MGHAEVHGGDDVGVSHPRHELGLAVKTLLGEGVFVVREELQRDPRAEVDVPRQVHPPHAARADHGCLATAVVHRTLPADHRFATVRRRAGDQRHPVRAGAGVAP
mgnify:CR=1 FL=1